MDPENQAHIKKIAEELPGDDLIVVLGASDIEGAEIIAETVTSGDPGFAGPLAGVSLGLPVYHILEPEAKAAIPEDVYEEQVGLVSMIVDVEEVGRKFKAARDANSR
jgi:glycine/sarcosine/betaine reductase complex component A